MRNIKFLVLAFIVLSMGLVSCSSDDNSTSKLTEADIIGFWESDNESIVVNGKVIFYNEDFSFESCNYESLNFRADKIVEDTETYIRYDECVTSTEDEPWELSESWKWEGQVLRWGEDYGEYMNEVPVRREGNYLIFSGTQIVDELFIESFAYKYYQIDYEFVIGEEVYFEKVLRKK